MEDEDSILENELFDKLETIFEKEEWTDIEEDNNVINTSEINTILFKTVEENVSQKDDEDIEWIKKILESKIENTESKELLKRAKKARPNKNKNNKRVSNENIEEVSGINIAESTTSVSETENMDQQDKNQYTAIENNDTIHKTLK
ncbi:unnamed protein product [Brachionus calyciflorus]|uniref:Uncharacterized protein n=1 Tax=Brachionus calyciflorus TaxID=104777 RepID=A0A814I8C4_9BILA|nr:unnamed protein product [Brachionus calyciflorus]